MNWFSDRKKLTTEYEKWLSQEPELKDCAFNVISFLEGKGLLKNIKEISIELTDKNNVTNADKIRNMPDEELAEFLCNISMCKPDYCPAYENCMRTEHGSMKKWLRSEVNN